MTTRRWLGTAAALLAAAGFVAVVTPRLGPLAHHDDVSRRPTTPYYDLTAGQRIHFPVAASDTLRLAVRPVVAAPGAPTAPALELRFLGHDGAELARRRQLLASDRRSSESYAGVAWSAPYVVALAPPDKTTAVEAEVSGARAALRLTRLLDAPSVKLRATQPSGVLPRYLLPEERGQLKPRISATVPSSDTLPIVQLPVPISPPLLPALAMPPPPMVSRVYNVAGPGRLTVLVEGRGLYRARLYGARSGSHRLSPTRAEVFTIPRGLASLVVSPAGSPATEHEPDRIICRFQPRGTRDEETLAPATRSSLALLVTPEAPLLVPVEPTTTVRISGRSLDAAGNVTLQVHPLEGHGGALQPLPALTLAAQHDPFAWAERALTERPVGQEARQFLRTGAQTHSLRVSASGPALVSVQVRVEEASDPSHLPPFTEPLPEGIRVVDAVERAPAWFLLRPLAAAAAPTEHWSIVRMPRLEPRPPPRDEEEQAIVPRGGFASNELKERFGAHAHPGRGFLTPGQPLRVKVEADGPGARHLALHCETHERLGGTLQLFVDGAAKGRTRFVAATAKIDVEVPPGPHRITLQGGDARCVVNAQPLSAGALAVRRVFQVPHHDEHERTITLDVTRPHRPGAVSCALYTPADGEEALAIEALVDEGRPRHRSGAASLITPGWRKWSAPLRDVDASVLNPTQRVLRAFAKVPLGDDLLPGHHEVVLRTEVAGPLWARCWLPGRAPHSESVTSWTISGD